MYRACKSVHSARGTVREGLSTSMGYAMQPLLLVDPSWRKFRPSYPSQRRATQFQGATRLPPAPAASPLPRTLPFNVISIPPVSLSIIPPSRCLVPRLQCLLLPRPNRAYSLQEPAARGRRREGAGGDEEDRGSGERVRGEGERDAEGEGGSDRVTGDGCTRSNGYATAASPHDARRVDTEERGRYPTDD